MFNELVEYRVLYLASIEFGNALKIVNRLVELSFGQQPLDALVEEYWEGQHSQSWQRCGPEVASPATQVNGHPRGDHQTDAIEHPQDDIQSEGAVLWAQVLKHYMNLENKNINLWRRQSTYPKYT